MAPQADQRLGGSAGSVLIPRWTATIALGFRQAAIAAQAFHAGDRPMLCSKCGAENPNSRAFCKSCGNSLWPTIKPKTAAVAPWGVGRPASVAETPHTPIDRPPAPPAVDPADVSDYYGVRGWLLWFCLVVAVFTPVMVLASVVHEKNGLAIAIELGLAALYIYTGIGLWRIKTSALNWVEILFIVQLALVALSALATIGSKRGPWERDFSINPFLEQGILRLSHTIIWWAYFKKSKRVRATYGRNL